MTDTIDKLISTDANPLENGETMPRTTITAEDRRMLSRLLELEQSVSDLENEVTDEENRLGIRSPIDLEQPTKDRSISGRWLALNQRATNLVKRTKRINDDAWLTMKSDCVGRLLN